MKDRKILEQNPALKDHLGRSVIDPGFKQIITKALTSLGFRKSSSDPEVGRADMASFGSPSTPSSFILLLGVFNP